jgi:cell division protein ZapD
VILYEYPFNESIRTMLRLEHLFDRLGQLIARDAAVDHHYALATLFEILDVSSRADLKSDLLKELDKHKQQFNSYRGNPSISEGALDEVIAKIDHAFNGLNDVQGKAGAALNSNEWLMSIRSRISIPGGTCEFDLPAYYAWQKFEPQRRRADLLHKVAAIGGQYQQRLPQGRVYQLMRVRLDEPEDIVPEISGHRLMVSVRLMRQDADGRLKPSQHDANFELTLCS